MMKKYLFLVVLFIVYLCVSQNDKTTPVISYESALKDGVNSLEISFNNGVNSIVLSKLFNNYKDDYYVTKINDVNVSCNVIDDCIKRVYNQEDEEFNTIYLANGFKVNKIWVLTRLGEIKTYLDDNNVRYVLKTD